MIRNIIFDWSGTLVDDLPAVWQATNYVLAQSERVEMSLEQFRAEFSLPFTAFYEKHTSHIPFPQLEAWFHARFQEVQGSVCALPHAGTFIEFCRQHRLRMFLLSTVRQDHFNVQHRASGFGDFLEKSYLGVWDKRQKIHELIAENELQPEETLFIGDMQHDIETARHGGIHSCAVLTGYNTLDQLRLAQPDLIVEHLGELREILEQNGLHLRPQPKPFEEAHPPVVTVGALVFNDAGEVLLVRTHKWSDLWGIPGGKTKWGETSEAALRREIKEETALELADIAFVLVQDCIHSKEFYRAAHFVLLNYTARAPGRQSVTLNGEAQEYRWMSLAAALQMPVNTPTRTLLATVAARSGLLPSDEPARGTGVSPVRTETPGRDARATTAATTGEGTPVQGFKTRNARSADSLPATKERGAAEILARAAAANRPHNTARARTGSTSRKKQN